MPLQKPIEQLKESDDYKIQLSFDGDRHLTQWLKIMGRDVPGVPLVLVELDASGEELLGVSAQVVAAPVPYLHEHQQLVQEFRNASHWPKHLLVRYHWRVQNDVDLNRGLYVLFAAGLLVVFIMAINAMRGSERKLARFLEEMIGEGPEGAGSSSSGAAGSSGSPVAPVHHASIFAKGAGKAE